jgi:hypothetical protein
MGRFSSPYSTRSIEKNSSGGNNQTSVEMCKFLPYSFADIHSGCFSSAIDLIPLNIISLIERQKDIFDVVFTPSDIVIGLLLPGSPVYMKPHLFENCKRQFAKAFKTAVENIRKRQNRGIGCHVRNILLVVSANGRINMEFLDEVQKYLELPPNAQFRDYEFKLRYGEELFIWATKYAEVIETQGFKFSEYGNLILCGEKKIIYNEGAD